MGRKIHYLNLIPGKEKYTQDDIKAPMEEASFNKIFGKPEHLKQFNMIVLEASVLKKLRAGESVNKLELGEASQTEVKTLASKNELLQSENFEQKSEIEILQAKIKELESIQSNSKEVSQNDTSDETPAKTEAKKTTKK